MSKITLKWQSKESKKCLNSNKNTRHIKVILYEKTKMDLDDAKKIEKYVSFHTSPLKLIKYLLLRCQLMS